MKIIKLLLPLLAMSILFFSCEENDKDPQTENETAQFKQVTSFTAEDYNIDIFTDLGKLQTGYNHIYLQAGKIS